jgi:hypothetical protein
VRGGAGLVPDRDLARRDNAHWRVDAANYGRGSKQSRTCPRSRLAGVAGCVRRRIGRSPFREPWTLSPVLICPLLWAQYCTAKV